MKAIQWNEEKNRQLKQTRGISFEDVVHALANDQIIAHYEGKGKFAHQKQFVVNIRQYPYVVPYVEDEQKLFLKTIFPNRKLKHLINE
ncbi:MAG: DUF4258 domain-containing protein [bacterium]